SRTRCWGGTWMLLGPVEGSVDAGSAARTPRVAAADAHGALRIGDLGCVRRPLRAALGNSLPAPDAQQEGYGRHGVRAAVAEGAGAVTWPRRATYLAARWEPEPPLTTVRCGFTGAMRAA